MKKIILFLFFSSLLIHAQAQGERKDTVALKPDTVKLGIYVTSIHDTDLKQKE